MRISVPCGPLRAISNDAPIMLARYFMILSPMPLPDSAAFQQQRLASIKPGDRPSYARFPGTHFFGFGVLALPPGNLAAAVGPKLATKVA